MNEEALNQVPPLQGYDAYGADPWLRAAVRRAGATWIEGAAHELGRYAGSAEAQAHAASANRNTPELVTHDRSGNRIDFVDYHPSYHALMARAIGAGVHSLAWKHASGQDASGAPSFRRNAGITRTCTTSCCPPRSTARASSRA